MTNPVPLTSTVFWGFGGVASVALVCTTGFAEGLGAGRIEKSPAFAIPPDLIFATQFAMTGNSFPVDSRLNWSVVPLATATIRCAFRSWSLAAPLGTIDVTMSVLTAVPNRWY